MRRLFFILLTLLPAVFFTGTAAAEKGDAEESPDTISVELRCDGEAFFLDLEAGESRIKLDSGAGEYEVYIPKDPESEEPYFRESDLSIVVEDEEDRITITARGDKEAIRRELDDIFEGSEEETEGIIINELDDGYEIIIRGNNDETDKSKEMNG